MKYLQLLFLFLPAIFISSTSQDKNENPEPANPKELTIDQANTLATLPLECIQKQYPNKPGQTLGSKSDIDEPAILHPAFYGCFNWHSSVQGH
jgi:hypothetical protein